MPTSPSTPSRLVATLLLALLGGLVTVVVGAGPASAHAALRSTTPAAGELVEGTPREVVLRFSEAPLAVGAVVEVRSRAGTLVSTKAPAVVGDEVRQALHSLPPGDYRVAWRVTSGDGHPLSDTFSFEVVSPSTGASPTSTSPATASPTTPSAGGTAGHHGSGVHAGDDVAFAHVAGTVVILLLGALGCAVSLRRSTST